MVWRKKTQENFSSRELLEKLSPNRSNFKIKLKMLFEILSIFLLIIALVNPKIGTELKTVKREGVDIVFALDISKSMLAEDVAPNRLQKSKRLISEIINSLGSDRVGILVYAEQAVPQVPLTTDFASVKNFLRMIDTDILSSQGTSIDSAINLSINYFDKDSDTNRVLIILSDGEDHDDISQKIVESIPAEGINLLAVGIGDDNGSTIPLRINGIIDSYKKDNNGQVVITKRNSEILQKLAKGSNGIYLDGNDTEMVLDNIKTKLNEIDKTEFETNKFVDYRQRFQFFLSLSLFFIIADVFLFETKTKWIQKLNLFNEK
jgi:Ca-activated chloride channel family protein